MIWRLFYKSLKAVACITFFAYGFVCILIIFKMKTATLESIYWNTRGQENLQLSAKYFEEIKNPNGFIFNNGSNLENTLHTKTLLYKQKIKHVLSTILQLSKDTTSSSQLKQWSNETKLYFKPFFKDVLSFCNKQIYLYNNIIILFKNLTIYPRLSSTKGQAGANALDVLNQKEENEDYIFEKGFFSKSCDLSTYSVFDSLKLRNAYLKWANAFQVWNREINTSGHHLNSKFTVVVKRNEYANVYWTLMDIYDVFLTATFFNQSANGTSILLLDAKPSSHLDPLWNMFHSVKRPDDWKTPVLHTNVNWLFPRDSSPFLVRTQTPIPLLLEFREAMLRSFGVSSAYKRECGKLNISFLWRRNYIAHPRNPSGIISRKIKNEVELIKTSQQVFPKYRIMGYQFDLYNMNEQMEILSKTDILIGMHGAGMSYSIFLPNHSAVIEMFPAYYKSYNWHMEFLARRSGHVYLKWKNHNSALENIQLQYTFVPPGVVVNLIYKSIKLICPVSSKRD